MNEQTKTTDWRDPRLTDSTLNKFESMQAPVIVKVGFALYDIVVNNGFHHVDPPSLQNIIEKHEGTDPKSFIRKNDFQELAAKTIKEDRTRNAERITDRLFSLLDLKHENEIEFRVALLGLIFLTELSVYKKIQLSFTVLDTNRKQKLGQEALFVMFKTITRLIENHRYRYKIAFSNKAIVADVYKCLQSFRLKKGRENDGTITFPEFIQYAIDDPLSIRPLSMLEKIQNSRETLHHGKTCFICTQTPIKGIRYRIEQTKQNICEKCFWKGQERGEFTKKIDVIEYPAEHNASKKAMEKVAGRFLPIIRKDQHPEDPEAKSREYIDVDNQLVQQIPPNTVIAGLDDDDEIEQEDEKSEDSEDTEEDTEEDSD